MNIEIVKTFKDYLNVINSIKESSIPEKQNFGSNFIVYRGQPVDKPLIPKLGRTPYVINRQKDAELPIKHSNRNLLTIEKDMLNEFKATSIPYTETLFLKPNTVFQWLSLAQHYGMATRLLDWTGNPLAALWFAIGEKDQGKFHSNESNLENEESKEYDHFSSVVYILSQRRVETNKYERFILSEAELMDKKIENKFELCTDIAKPKKPMLKPKAFDKNAPDKEKEKLWFFRPMYSSQRMISQDAFHSISLLRPHEDKKMARKGWYKFIPVEEKEFKDHNIVLTKVIIRPEGDEKSIQQIKGFKDIMHELSCYGINGKTMFPELQGLCRYINWLEKDDEFIKWCKIN